MYTHIWPVCDHGKHRNDKRYNFECNCLVGAKQNLHPKPYRLAKQNSLCNVIARTKQKHISMYIYIYIYREREIIDVYTVCSGLI